MFRRVDICLSVETDRVNDERLAFPLCYRVPEPLRLQVFRVIPSVREHHVKNVVGFEQEREAIRLLHDLDWILHLPGSRVAPWKTVGGVVDAWTLPALRALGCE